MARLPSGEWLVQKLITDVVVFHEHTEEEIVRVPFYANPDDRPSLFAKAVKALHDAHKAGKFGEEDTEFAIFWLGYFYRASCEEPRPKPRIENLTGIQFGDGNSQVNNF